MWKRKLKTTGNKNELVVRLETALSLEDQYNSESGDGESDDEDGRRNDTSQAHRERRKFVPSFKDVEASMETFSGDDRTNVTQWLLNFEKTAELCEWEELQNIIYAKRLLRGSAKLFVKFERCGRSWNKLKKSLKHEFSEKVDRYVVHKQLSRRKKQPDESYQQYIYCMLDIAAQANLEVRCVLRYIIDGVQDEERNKIMLYGATTVRELKDRFVAYKQMKEATRGKKKHVEGEKPKPKSTTEMKETKHCFNCGKKGHLVQSCPTKAIEPKCF